MINLIGILVIALGFALRFNTLLVVMAAGIVTGLVAGMSFNEIMEAFGRYFVENRYMTLPVVLMVPLIGLLERHGLQERAVTLIRKAKALTAGRIILLYAGLRQLSVALGINIGSGGAHAGLVRPLVAPMAEAAARQQGLLQAEAAGALQAETAARQQGLLHIGAVTGSDAEPAGRKMAGAKEVQLSLGAAPRELSGKTSEVIRAHAAAGENIGNFFGEDIFIAVGAVLLMKGFFDAVGLEVGLWPMALWGIPTALVAFGVLAWRMRALDRKIAREGRENAAERNPKDLT
jgi:uncharacterized membrane protein